MTDLHESVVALGLAFARRMGVAHRQRVEGDTQGVRDADRESQEEVAARLGDVYRCFGPDPEALQDAQHVADTVRLALSLQPGYAEWRDDLLARLAERREGS